MEAANGMAGSEDTIHIDIQDTVSATVDNKLEYTASTQGPSFADLFEDVKSTPPSNSGDGIGVAASDDLEKLHSINDLEREPTLKRENEFDNALDGAEQMMEEKGNAEIGAEPQSFTREGNTIPIALELSASETPAVPMSTSDGKPAPPVLSATAVEETPVPQVVPASTIEETPVPQAVTASTIGETSVPQTVTASTIGETPIPPAEPVPASEETLVPAAVPVSVEQETSVPSVVPLSAMLNLNAEESQNSQNEQSKKLNEPSVPVGEDESAELKEEAEMQAPLRPLHPEIPDSAGVIPTQSIFSQKDDLHISPVIRTVTAETGDGKATPNLGDNREVSDNGDTQEDLEDVDLKDLLKAQSSSRKDDFDEEFDFESPTEKPATKPLKQEEDRREQTVAAVVASTQLGSENKSAEVPLQHEPEAAPTVVDTSSIVKTKETTGEEPVTVEGDNDQDDRAKVEDEWANVQTITPGFGDSSTGKVGGASTKVISYTEALQAFLCANLDQYKGQILRNVQRSGFKKLKHALFGPPKLHRDFTEQRDQYLCMTQYSFENNNPDHGRILQTINKRLTGAKFDCPRQGSHWEHIGFQGNDPVTDLRGCGMLGLLQLVYVTTTPKYLPLTRDIYKLSLHETQNFPFCIMGINITRMSIQALREDCLNKEINKLRGDSDLLTYMMQFYMATFYHLYSIWKSQHKTIADTGFVIRDVEAYIKKNPARLIADLEKKLSSGSSPAGAEASQEPAIQFTKFTDD